MTTTHHTNEAFDCCTVAQPADIADDFESSSCCSVAPTGKKDSEALTQILSREVAPEVAALRSAGFRLLLEKSSPVTRQKLATEASLDLSVVNEILDTRAQGRVQLDDRGDLVGIAGLTVEPTRHRLDIDGKTRWTWCALDAVGILGALGATGSIHSIDPRTSDPVEINFTDGHPDGDATLFILGGFDGGNVVEDWCPLVNFFTNRTDAQAWATNNGLDGDIVSVSDITEGATAAWRPVVDTTSPPTS